MTPPPSRRSAFVLALAGVVAALLLAEGLLRLYVTIAGYPGEEATGWRNTTELHEADVVVIGDSMVYGYNVPTQAAWPQQLGRMLHRPVYQMAHGGWGPAEYLLTLKEALALRPKVVIVGFYLGNDLGDAYAYVYHTAHHAGGVPDTRLSRFLTSDPKTRDLLQRAEAIDPGFRQWGVLRCDLDAHMVTPTPRWQPMGERLAASPPAGDGSAQPARSGESAGRVTSSIRPLLHASVLYQLGRPALSRTWRRVTHKGRDYGSPICVHFAEGRIRTVFGAADRLALLDLTDPRLAEGKRIGFAIFREMAERCRQAGVRFYIMIEPTKETVFRARALSMMQDEPYLRAEWDAESGVRSETLSFLKAGGIAAIDPLPALEGVVAAGVNPYPATADPHPIAAGYEAIARTAAERLRHDGF